MKPATQWLLDIHDQKYFGKGLQVVIEDIQRDALEAAAALVDKINEEEGDAWAGEAAHIDATRIRALMPRGESLASTDSQSAATDGTANQTARTE